MKLLFSTIFIIISVNITSAQTFQYSGSIGKFKEASSFHINSTGFLFVTDRGTNEIFKMDTLGNVLKENGGFGWDAAAFDDPQGIFATTLNVYVCDKNNHRVQFFDKDLNYLSQLITRSSENEEIQFGYPASAVVNKQGDLLVLDTENRRIIKFDLFGNFMQNFGGYNYGRYSLNNPKKLATGPANMVYAADNSRLLLFDQYGNGIGEFPTESEIIDVNIVFNNLSLVTEDKVMMTVIGSGEFRFEEIETGDYSPDGKILSSLIFNNKLYLLTSRQIDVLTRTAE